MFFSGIFFLRTTRPSPSTVITCATKGFSCVSPYRLRRSKYRMLTIYLYTYIQNRFSFTRPIYTSTMRRCRSIIAEWYFRNPVRVHVPYRLIDVNLIAIASVPFRRVKSLAQWDRVRGATFNSIPTSVECLVRDLIDRGKSNFLTRFRRNGSF